MPTANPKSKMRQWTARVRTTREEIWTVEAKTEEEARDKLESASTVDEQGLETVDWEVDLKSIKDEG